MKTNKEKAMSSGRRSLSLAVLLFTFFSMQPVCLGNTTTSTAAVSTTTLTTDPGTTAGLVASDTTSAVSTASDTTIESTTYATTSTSGLVPQENITCSPVSVKLEVCEFPSSGAYGCTFPSCSTLLNCKFHTSAKQNVTGPLFSLIGSAGDYFYGNATRQSSRDEIAICVNATAFDMIPGIYQWTLGLTYIIDGEPENILLIGVNLTVNDVNERPVIDFPGQNFTILENITVGSTVFAFNVSDPDARYPNGTAAYKELAEPSLRGQGVFTTDGLAVREKSPQQYEVYVNTSQNATKRSSYSIVIRVSDKSTSFPLQGIQTASITIADVNEPPQCSSDVTVNVDVTSAVGSLLGRLECWDWDVMTDFREIQYSPSTLFSFLNVSSDGNITLVSAVTRDTVSMAEVVSVFAPLYPDVSTTVTVSLEVHNYPPECSSTQNKVSILDSVAVGTCSKVTVQCSTNGPDTTLDVTNSTDGPVRWTISQGNIDTDSSLDFTVCVTDVLYHFIGQYEASLNVSNSTGVTSVTWSVTIDDVNQPPAFLSASYIIQVSENTAVQTTIAQVPLVTSRAMADSSSNNVITVWDPDNVTAGFEFKGINVQSVNVTYPNSSQVTTTDQSNLPVYLRNDSSPPFSFLTRSPLSAGVRLAFTLQAEDEQGLVSSNTVVTFVVSDVNQAPVCVSDNFNLTVGLITQMNDSIYTVSCTDNDVNSTLSSLTYHEYTTSDADYQYFSISSGGEISLEQRLPLNVTTLTYTVYVIDGGGLVANFTLFVDIDRNFPPTCTLPSTNRLTLPETANTSQCDTLTLECSHRTELDHYGLTFNVSFVYNTSLFQVDQQVGGLPSSQINVTGCPNTDLFGNAGSYNLGFTVSSELGTYPNTLDIVVTDVNQPPQFDQDSYMFNVSEDTPSGATVAHVELGSSSAVAGRNEIVVTDPDTGSTFLLDTVQETGVSLFNANGSQIAMGQSPGIVYSFPNFTVSGALTPEQYYVISLTARDRGGLSATATVIISIYDVNEPPACPSFFETRANLTSSIGSAIFTVNCVDNDVKAEYKSVTYGEYQTHDFGYFNVSTTGDVTLASNFPADVNRLRYDVFARDGAGLTTNVTLFVDINRDFGPECTPSSQVDVNFPEDALSGACSQTLVTCTDTSGRSLPMTVRVISDATQGEIRVNDNRGSNTNTVALEACVTAPSSPLMAVGQFEITVEVNNTLNVTQVTFNVTVTDVNQPPFFAKTAYLTTVPEFVSGSSTTTIATVRSPSGSTPSSADIVDIVNDDPDTQAHFGIVSLQHALRAEYTNGTDYEGSFIGSEPITMSGKDIVAVASLRPDLVYFVKLTVTDGQGLSANTTLEIKVTDVNEPPSCPLKTEISLDLLESVQTVVASVSCTDSDYNDTYRDLSYFSHQEADHAYFGVEMNGDVKLVTSVPRDALQLVLKAYAIDGGGLEANTTLTFIIDRNHPPDCFPSYVPPDGVWEFDKCFRVYPNCSDPTTPDGDKRFLIYTFTGSWQNGFRQTVQVNDTYDYAEFCYTLRSDGNFKIQLAASNGLGNHTWEQDVIVSYKDASPKFTTNRYNAVPVNETAAVGFLVETVQALVDGQSVPLVYSFTDAGPFDQYFAIDSNTGNITVLKDLSPLANTEAKFYVLATDPATNLNHSAPVVVQVTDINQSPTCSPTVISVTKPWSVTPNDVITRVNCSDPDPTSRFSQLSYSIATPGSNMWRSDQTAVKLLSRVLLDPMTSQYIAHVLATDTTFTATTTVTINIDRTPPKPVLRVSNVKTDTANIAWTFDQQYLPVISNFVITISDSSNIPRTFVADKTSLSYVITGLTEVETYRVDVTANGFANNTTSDEVSFTTPPIAILQQVCAEIKLTNETWSPDLLDNTSVAFIDLGNKVENGVHNRLRSVRGYVSADVRSFRSGSVYADLVVTYNQSLSDTNELRSELSSLVNSGSVGNLPVDSSYKPFYIGAFYIADASLEYTSPGKISDPVVSGLHFIVTGYDVTATCSARTPGVSEPKFYWMLDGRNVTSMQSSARYVISSTSRSDNDPYKFTSSVTIKEILTTESGQLVCKVIADAKTDSKQVALKVVRRQVTVLRPPTSVVIKGSDVSLICERRAGYDIPWQATLYRVESDGSQEQVKVANMTYQEKQANFTVRVTSGVHYRCDVRDSIATAVSSDANIIIRQPAARQCPTDGVWTETPAGNTLQLECPQDYTDGGLRYRTCGTNGVWQEPDSSGCVRQDLEDWRTTVGQVEEGTTTSTTRDVVEGLQNSTSGPLLRGDVTVAVEILDRVAKFTVDKNQAPGDDELEKFVKSADNVLQAPSDVWQNQTGKAMSLVNAVDRMGKASSRTLNSSGPRPPIESDKIVLQVGRSDRNDIVFPIPSESNSYPPWVTDANNSAFLSKDAFHSSIGEVQYSAVIYRNLSNVFSGQLDQSLTGQSELSINSPILSLSLALDDVTIITPVRLTFDHITDNFTSISCQFLNFSASAEGIWSTNDCRVKESNSTMTVCECDHLTNFAVLMSPYRPVTEIANVLNVFSIVGCSISIFCLILTLVIYFIFWRHVRSDRSKLLLHLCVVLVIAYVTFLAGVNQVEHENACTVVAVLLHYLWLVVFFLMLCEGIDIFISIVHVFPTKSGLVPLLIMAYGVPLIIVGVSMGVTKMEGYGGTDFCWLSLESGLLWAFVGPALAALMANFVFVALVIRALLSAHVMTTKDERQKAKSVVKAICVMTPILGLSWIFGVMSVNDDTVVFQVLFVVFNSLQGLMIFILHCLLSKQIREAMQHKRRRQQAQYRSTDDSTSKYIGQKQSSESTMSSNDLDKKSISPFLQVDRQVQQMASKLSMLDSSNFMTTNDTPKVMALKNPVAVATDKTSDEGPPFNIQLNESTTDDLDNAKEEPILAKSEPEFRIEAGNLKSVSKPSSSPSEATYATAESGRGQGQVQVTRDGVRPTGSNEDNAQQSKMNMRPANRETAPSWVEPAQRIGPQPARKVSQTSRSAESSSSKGSKQSSQNQGRTTQERDNNSRDRARERELSKKPAANIPVLEDDQHRRLDHVYGAGARISDDNSIMGGVSAKTKGGRPSRSTENIRMTSAPRNPIYNDAVPALSPTDRWVRVAQSSKPQQQQQRRGQQHPPVRHPPHPAPFQQPRPPSPRRMATSAESLSAPHFQPFAAPRQGDKRHGNKKPPPQVAAKPSRWHNDPPVDYW